MLAEFKFHHIGIATPNIDKTSNIYIQAGYNKTETIVDSIQNVAICFLTKDNMPMIELLSPVNEDSPVNNFLKKVGVAPYHICYEVENIAEAVTKLKQQRYIPLFLPIEAIAIENRKICFLFNKDIGLIELVETARL